MDARVSRSLIVLGDHAKEHFSMPSGKKRAGVFARTWSIGTTALWIAVLLTAYVVFYLI